MASHLRVHLNGFGVRFNMAFAFISLTNDYLTNRFRHQQSDTVLGHFVRLQIVPDVCDDWHWRIGCVFIVRIHRFTFTLVKIFESSHYNQIDSYRKLKVVVWRRWILFLDRFPLKNDRTISISATEVRRSPNLRFYFIYFFILRYWRIRHDHRTQSSALKWFYPKSLMNLYIWITSYSQVLHYFWLYNLTLMLS